MGFDVFLVMIVEVFSIMYVLENMVEELDVCLGGDIYFYQLCYLDYKLMKNLFLFWFLDVVFVLVLVFERYYY